MFGLEFRGSSPGSVRAVLVAASMAGVAGCVEIAPADQPATALAGRTPASVAAVTVTPAPATPTPPRVVAPTPVPPTQTRPASASPTPPQAVFVRPTIRQYEVSSRAAVPGDTLTFTFVLTNANTAAVDVILGASLRAVSDGQIVNDTPNDKLVTINPGGGSFSRPFHLGSDVRPGSYDVLWGLIGADKTTSYGLEKQPGYVEIRAAPSVAATTPDQTVRQYYTLIAKRDYNSAWALLTPNAQQALKGFTIWRSGFANTTSVQVISAETTAAGVGGATVAVSLVAQLAPASGGSTRQTFQGTWQLVRSSTGAGWNLDRANMKQTS